MARITFSLNELLAILISNRVLPSQIVRARAQGERIHFIIRTDSFILPFIPVSLKYLRFDGNTVVFEFTLVSSHLNKAVSWLNQRLEVKVPAFVRFQYPDVFVDVGKLLEQKNIRGVRVREIHFEDGEFAIVTENV